MRISRPLATFACTAVLALWAAACAKKEEGPAEKAGRAIDDAMRDSARKMGEASEKMGESMRQAGQKMGEAMEETGKKMQQERTGH